MSRRSFYVVSLLVALLVAGFASYYASAHPDGLEYVAEQTGFLDTAEEEHAASDSPLADYQTTGIDNERLSGGIAGVAGVLLVLVVSGGLFLALRRRGDDESQHTEPQHTEPS
ncbi:PDGLE domain-containing protein [Nocardioides houyundeii]|uniref:PDGLE domain-containing protein n=1 Tax=Nocardioides houyundeii TaxID=2045452 RepID=UPI0018EF652A|nr:PDGLE domain-containing protein [Nocardioides houyundeii]